MIGATPSDEEQVAEAILLDSAVADRAPDADAFLDPFVHSFIKTALALRAQGLRVDSISLHAQNRDLDAARLADLESRALSSANADFYIDRVKRAYDQRRAETILRGGIEALERGDEGAAVDVARKLSEIGAECGPVIHSLRDEQLADLPPRKWFIEGMITPGLVILSARKGLGKSFFALQAAASIASGGTFLGLDTFRANVLLVELELDRTALHERAKHLPPLPIEGLDVTYNFPRGEEALRLLESLVKRGYSVVVIDMLGGILPTDTETNSYDLTPWLLRLRHIGLDNGATIFALHHSTKSDSGDPVSNLMGSTAFGGQSDSIITIERKRGEPGAKIAVCGNHGSELLIPARFDSCRWIRTADEEPEGPRLSPVDASIVRLLGDAPAGLGVGDIAPQINKGEAATRAALNRLRARCLVDKTGTIWHLPRKELFAERGAAASHPEAGL